MKDLCILLGHLLTTIARLLRPGGARAVAAKSALVKQQVLVIKRSRRRAPNLSPLDRFLFGFWGLLLGPCRIRRASIILRPSTPLSSSEALKKRKYRLLCTPRRRGKPGPKGPCQQLIQIPVEMKRRNIRFGCPRIPQQIAHDFGVDIDKEVVRRVLANHYDLRPGAGGPPWLTLLGHLKDSLWSVDLFRCESMQLKAHWVMVVMDQFTRRIIGFAVHVGDVDGVAVCRMFNEAVSRMGLPDYLRSDHDPLFEYHPWHANLRVLGIAQIKTVPYVPLSHPFVERLIGTGRRDLPDHTLFWNSRDLERKLGEFKEYYNEDRVHGALGGIRLRKQAEYERPPGRSPKIPMASSLPRAVRATHGGVIGNSPCTRALSPTRRRYARVRLDVPHLEPFACADPPHPLWRAQGAAARAAASAANAGGETLRRCPPAAHPGRCTPGEPCCRRGPPGEKGAMA